MEWHRLLRSMLENRADVNKPRLLHAYFKAVLKVWITLEFFKRNQLAVACVDAAIRAKSLKVYRHIKGLSCCFTQSNLNVVQVVFVQVNHENEIVPSVPLVCHRNYVAVLRALNFVGQWKSMLLAAEHKRWPIDKIVSQFRLVLRFLKHALKALNGGVEAPPAPRVSIAGTSAVGGPSPASAAAAPSNRDNSPPKAAKPTAAAPQASTKATATPAAPATGNTDGQPSLPTPATKSHTDATKHTARPQNQTPLIAKKLKRKHKDTSQYPVVKRRSCVEQRGTYLVIDHGHEGFVHKCAVH